MPPAQPPAAEPTLLREPLLRWDPLKQPAYVVAVLQQVHLWQQLHAAVAAGSVALASGLITSIVWAAAAAAGMIVDPSVRAVRAAYNRLSFDAASWQVLLDAKALWRAGEPLSDQLRGQVRAIMRRAKRRRQEFRHACALASFTHNPRKLWAQFTGKSRPPWAVMPARMWQQYFEALYGGQQPTLTLATDWGAAMLPQERQDMQVLVEPVEPGELVAVFRRLGTAKASGVDKLPAEFVTKVWSRFADGSVLFHFAQPLARMFSSVLQAADLPVDWKVTSIHPLHKKGSMTEPGNYRGLGVGTTMKRLFTGVLTARITPFTAPGPQSLLAPMQFAFRRQMGVEMAHLPVLAAIDMAAAKADPVVLVKLDIRKAYDTVHRALLWFAMQMAGFPVAFISVVQALYTEARYVVRVNGSYTAPFTSTIGLLQGCALSPVLYSVFLRQAIVDLHASCAQWGFVAAGNTPVCLVNFADDITGVLASLHHVGHFLDAAEHVLATVRQSLNRDKSQLLFIHPASPAVLGQRAAHAERQLLPGDPSARFAGVPVVTSMKLLGVWYSADGSLAHNLQVRCGAARSKVALDLARLRRAGCARDLRITLLLLNADVRPTLLFAAPLWGHNDLHVDPLKHPLQPIFSVLMRHALGLAASTAHWIALLMTGQMPIQFWVVRDFHNFWNRCLDVAAVNPFLDACLRVQTALAADGKPCWLRRWITGLQRLMPQMPGIRPAFTSMQHVVITGPAGCMHHMRMSYEERLAACGDPLTEAAVPHRKIALHFCCMWPKQWGKRPWWHWCRVPDEVWRHWLRFLAGLAPVPTQALAGSTVPFAQRRCCKCERHCIGHEQHVLLRCPVTAPTRHAFQDKLLWPQSGLLCDFLNLNRHRTDLLVYVHVVFTEYLAAPQLQGA